MKRLALVLLLTLCSLPVSAQSTVTSPDGRRQMTAIRATGPITIDGVARRRGLAARRRRPRISSRPTRSKGSRRPSSPKCASPSTTTTSTSRRSAATPTRPALSSTRSARTSPAASRTPSRCSSTRSPIAATASCSRPTPQGAKADTQIANEGRDVNPNWDAVWWVEARQDRRRLDGGVPHPVQDAALRSRRRHRPGASTSRAASAARTRSATGRRCRAPTRSIAPRPPATSTGLPPLRPGPQPPHQAVSRSAARCAASAKARFDRDLQRRRRRQGRRHAVADARRHDQSRLRAGRSRRAASQPHAVQPVLPGEARVLPRELRHLLLRRHPAQPAPGQPLPSARRRPAALLQPPHRPDRQRRAGTAATAACA